MKPRRLSFVEDRAVPGNALAARLARRGASAIAFGRERPAVGAEFEHRRVQAEGPVDRDRVGVGEQLGDVEAVAALGIERAVGAQAVARARADAVGTKPRWTPSPSA